MTPQPNNPNKLVYSPSLNKTYVMGPDGTTHLDTLDGDQTSNFNAMFTNRPTEQGNQDKTNYAMQQLKDLGVNVASGLPYAAIPEVGILRRLAKPITSLFAGTALDQLFNRSSGKPLEESLGSAAVNTGVNELTGGLDLLGSKLRVSMPAKLKTTTIERMPTLTERVSNLQRSGSSKGTSITRPLGDVIENEPSDVMKAAQVEINRLKSITPKNKSQATQIDNAIDKHQEALDILTEANEISGSHTQFERTGKGTSELQSSGITKLGSYKRIESTSGDTLAERVLHSIHFDRTGKPLTPLQQAMISLGLNQLVDLGDTNK